MNEDRNLQLRAASLLLDRAESWFLMPMKHRCFKVGFALGKLSDDDRKLMSHLKSKDLCNVRWPPWK